MSSPVYGLILAGGSSSRMQRDKAALLYQGRNQLGRAFDLAARHVGQVFVSVRASQAADPSRAHYPLIVDSVPGEGPIVGIRSALAARPEVAWLILACDLPFLSDAALARLLAERDAELLATAYRSAHDDLPEPLCAVWEPRAAAALAHYQASGGHCPRKFLMRHAVRLIEPLDRQSLDNVNTPEEYARALGVARFHPASRSHATQNPVLRLDARASRPLRGDDRDRGGDPCRSVLGTQSALRLHLAARTIEGRRQQRIFRVVAPPDDGDAVVFIPPVAGG